MSGYTPVFRSVFQGSLCGKFPDLPLWLVLLALADKNGEIDAHPSYIATVCGIDADEVSACIQRFCDPDPLSRTPDDDGRRLIPIEGRGFGWHIVNHGKYREKARLQAKSAREIESGKNAERMQNRRGPPMTAGHRPSNSDANSEEYTGQRPSAFDRFWLAYPRKRKKKTTREAWRRKGLDPRADDLIADVELRQRCDATWKRGYIPDPSTYVNQERWNDEVEAVARKDPFNGAI